MIKTLLHNVVQVVKSSPTVCTIIKWFAPPTTTHYFGFVMHSMNIFCVYSHFLHRVLLSCQYHHDDAVYSMSWTSIIVPLGFFSFFLSMYYTHIYIYTQVLYLAVPFLICECVYVYGLRMFFAIKLSFVLYYKIKTKNSLAFCLISKHVPWMMEVTVWHKTFI